MTTDGPTPPGDASRSARSRMCVRCRQLVESTCVVCPADGQRTLLVSPSNDPLVGRSIGGRFTLLGLLGEGGMGVVYRALQHSMEREVAIKLLHRSYADNPEAIERFMREARGASRLAHSNIITLFDFGLSGDGELYLVMELLRGRALASILNDEGRLTPERAVHLGVQVCDALEAAHNEGVIHRDLKPENVFVLAEGSGRGELVKVIDFGIAKVTDADPYTTPGGTGLIVGSPGYMSPEQVMGRDVDGRSDLYALGIVLYEMLAGRVPFPYDEPVDCLHAQVHHDPPPLRDLRPEVPEALAATIHEALAKQPRDRPANGTALRDRLLASLGQPRSAAWSGRDVGMCVARTNIVRGPTSFIGRVADLDALRRLFDSGCRLVMVLGPGGMGKTRLAMHLAREMCEAASGEALRGGAWLCDLTDSFTLDLVVQELARVLGVTVALDDEGDSVARIGDALVSRGPMLLILDHVEQITELVGPALEQMLARAPQVRVLVTSRQKLRVSTEVVHELGPLGLPQGDEPAEAVQLFVDRARAVNPGFTLDAASRQAVAEVVRKLDGLPLAIELAAARTAVLSSAQILQRLRNRFQLLTGSPGVTTHPGIALRDVIDWSWSLLTSQEQAVLAQLSVFSGGFSMEAVEQVVDLSEFEDRQWIGDVAQSLRDKSLLRATTPPGFPGEVRLALYESIREFAALRLAERGDLAEIEARHAAYFLWVCAEWAEGARERGDADLARRLEQDVENVTAVYLRCMAARPRTVEKVEQALLALHVADPVLSRRGLAGVYFKWLVDALEVASAMDARPALYLKVAHARAKMLSRHGRFGHAIGYLEGVLDLARAVDDRWIEADCLLALGFCWSARGQPDRALDSLEAAWKAASRSGSAMLMCEVDKHAGLVRYMLGQYELAAAAFDSAVERARRHGFSLEVAVGLHNLGDAMARLGRYDEALAALHRSIEVCEAQGFDKMRDLNQLLIGCVQAVRTRRAESLADVERTLDAAREAGNNWVVVQAAYFLGCAHLGSGDLDRARELIEVSLEIAKLDDNKAYIRDCLAVLEQIDDGRDTEPTLV